MILTDWAPVILLMALALDALIGDPDALWGRVGHPVRWMGHLIDLADRYFNREEQPDPVRRNAGMSTMVFLVALSITAGIALHMLITGGWAGLVGEAVIVSILLAQRSLYDHVARVSLALAGGDLAAARRAVSTIVGRDPDSLDEAGIARASIETMAENYADGVVAPAFWYLFGGLPGLIAYKMINTADSMIGHRTPRHLEFGWAAARLDDLANWAPARLAGIVIAAVAFSIGGSARDAFSAMRASAPRHRSPNAGWPEAAMAGALDVAIAGPRIYDGDTVDDAWMNPSGRKDAGPEDVARGLRLLIAACLALAGGVGVLAIIL